MSFDLTMRSGSKLLRCGYTTGTCAALAASGAARLLLTGSTPASLALLTRGGIRVEVAPIFCRMEGNRAVCAVKKDAGDDPDVTDGMQILAEVKKTDSGIRIDGGTGVGRVTKPGLDRKVGEAAINTVPRQMITSAVKDVCEQAGYLGGLEIIISVPGGEEAAKKTFNPMLGIEGGISILGTSGIVEPMSERAIIDTIGTQIRQAASLGAKKLIALPGNYALDFLHAQLPDISAYPVIKCSNYLGETLDMAALCKMEELLLIGHIGKLVKLAGGIMNTHSRMADCRQELFCAHAALCGAEQELCRALMHQPTSDACLTLLEDAGLIAPVLESLLAAVQRHLSRRAEKTRVGAVIFSNTRGLLGMTEQAERMIREWRMP